MLAATMSLTALGGAWLAGWRIPGASGATWVKVTHLRASYNGNTAGPIFVMLVGSDLRDGVGGARGDALHILGINPELHAATILDIPRDTCATFGGHTRKINEANSNGGPAAQAKAVSDLTGVPLDYAVEVDFSGFKELVKSVGGLNINIPMRMHDDYSGAFFEPGYQHLDESGALAFSRNRHDFARSDIQRTWNQGYLLIAAVQQLQQQYKTMSGKFEIASMLVQHAQLSGLGISDLVRFGALANKVPAANIKNIEIPVTGGNCLGVSSGAAAALYRDFKDNARLDSYPSGTPTIPDPRP